MFGNSSQAQERLMERQQEARKPEQTNVCQNLVDGGRDAEGHFGRGSNIRWWRYWLVSAVCLGDGGRCARGGAWQDNPTGKSSDVYDAESGVEGRVG